MGGEFVCTEWGDSLPMRRAFPFDDEEANDPSFEPLDPVAYRIAYGETVKDLRERVRGCSLRLAERLSGVCRQHWRRVESGEQSATHHTELLMCKALRIHPDRLHAVALRWLRDREAVKWETVLLGLLPAL